MSKKQQRQQMSQAQMLVIGAIILLSGVFIGVLMNDRDGQEPVVQRQQPLLSADAYQVARQFYCSCGACSEDNLTSCDCETAEEERQFIERSLRSGKTQSEVVEEVKTKYGYSIGS